MKSEFVDNQGPHSEVGPSTLKNQGLQLCLKELTPGSMMTVSGIVVAVQEEIGTLCIDDGTAVLFALTHDYIDKESVSISVGNLVDAIVALGSSNELPSLVSVRKLKDPNVESLRIIESLRSADSESSAPVVAQSTQPAARIEPHSDVSESSLLKLISEFSAASTALLAHKLKQAIPTIELVLHEMAASGLIYMEKGEWKQL